jgi:hypothetical protein
LGNKNKILSIPARYVSLGSVIALGLITIVASGGGGNDATPTSIVEKSATPVFLPNAGSFDSDQYITIGSSTMGANIYYTTDNSAPSTSSTIYTTPVLVRGNGISETIKAIAVKAGMDNSDVAIGNFTINYNKTTSIWTWVSGDNSGNNILYHHVKYGTKGTGDKTSNPGARYGGVSWTDSAGDLWLFGGIGWDASGKNYGRFNDLWKYRPSTEEWTWVSGDDVINRPGVYGTKGDGDASNNPGARAFCVSWIDQYGYTWLFGGEGWDSSGVNRGVLNDLWKFDPVGSKWTWVSGDNITSQTGVYGAKGVGDISNKPGTRSGSVSWIDLSGNLWLFGGYGLSSSRIGVLNDLWKFDPLTLEWTWVSGDNTINEDGVYGQKGVGDISCKPGARYESVSWTDKAGDLWLFGGTEYDAYGNLGVLNDLWKFDPLTGEWTWVSGYEIGVYGPKGTEDASSLPRARALSMSWIDSSGGLWLLGGNAYNLNGSPVALNDLWKFNPFTGKWTWVSGDDTTNVPGVYGPKGTAYTSNKPGARTSGFSWIDPSGDLWLYGGQGYDVYGAQGDLNDVWRFRP